MSQISQSIPFKEIFFEKKAISNPYFSTSTKRKKWMLRTVVGRVLAIKNKKHRLLWRDLQDMFFLVLHRQCNSALSISVVGKEKGHVSIFSNVRSLTTPTGSWCLWKSLFFFFFKSWCIKHVKLNVMCIYHMQQRLHLNSELLLFLHRSITTF